MSVLNVVSLDVRRGRTAVLHGVDLTVERGEIVAILGPNGAGKSTLLAALSGLLKPSAGRIECDGRTATVLQSPGLARRSARANVELALRWWGVPRGERRSRARDALTLMHAEHLAKRPALSLSGGEQRRIHLARAIAVAPDVLLLDEPFDGLDPYTHAALREDVAAALRSAGSAVVVVLHERVDAWAMADRIVVLLDGRVQADATPQQLLDNPPTAEVARFLGYDGELSTRTGVSLTRAIHVRIVTRPGPTTRGAGAALRTLRGRLAADFAGPAVEVELAGTVVARVGIEDGYRVQIDTSRGRLWAQHLDGRVDVGDAVRVRVERSVTFPRPR